MTIHAVVFDAYGTLYDVHTVAAAAEEAFPGHGDYITQVWRLKQLEYSWLRAMMGRYEDFWTVTRDALAYTLGTLGIEPDPARLDSLASAYNRLGAYPDAGQALASLADYKLAILSNGSPAMLAELVRQSGFEHHFHAVISVDPRRVYKPDPRAYELVQEALGLPPAEVLFVSSNGFDVSGAKSFGFRVARIERVPATSLPSEIRIADVVGPATMFKALRTQEEVGFPGPDLVISSLSDLVRHVRGSP